MRFFASIFVATALCIGLTSCSDEATVFEGPGPKPNQVAAPAPASSVSDPSTVSWKGDDLQDVPVRGTVQDASGNPINATMVRLAPYDTTVQVYYDITGVDGVFDWVKVRTGTYVRTASAPGYPLYCDTLVVTAPDTTQILTLYP